MKIEILNVGVLQLIENKEKDIITKMKKVEKWLYKNLNDLFQNTDIDEVKRNSQYVNSFKISLKLQKDDNDLMHYFSLAIKEIAMSYYDSTDAYCTLIYELETDIYYWLFPDSINDDGENLSINFTLVTV